MKADEIIGEAEKRIAHFRMGEARIRITKREKPLRRLTLRIKQTRHDFKFGCNIFLWRDVETDWQMEYRRRFAELLNYATLPFYWPYFEPERGKPLYDHIDKVADWCLKNDVEMKGHPLVWNYSTPKWLPNNPDEIKRLSDERVREIVSHYRGKIEIWDVVNEATDPWRFDNPITETWRRFGQIEFAAQAFKIAGQANPNATLLINDYRTDPSYERVIKGLVDEEGKPLYDAIGIQSHMHRGVWKTEKIWEVCKRFSRFGVPLHFTETTIVSGKRTGDRWGETEPEMEERQAQEVERFYTVLFSHPAVEAITWWDFSDRNAWQAAPAGLLRKDMSPKPAYERLMDLIKRRWWTEIEAETDENGEFTFKGFYGRYKVEFKVDGELRSMEAYLRRNEPNFWSFNLPG